jgi:hypothetical protein
MKYRGHVENGVVVLENAPPLSNGTIVSVEPMDASLNVPPRGSAAAILRHAGTWQGDPGEMERLLSELTEAKWAEVEAENQQGTND